MSKTVASINFAEEVKSSFLLIVVVSLVLGYLIFNEQKKRRIPSDYDTIEQNIVKTKQKIKELIEGEELPDLTRSLQEIQVLAEGFGVAVKLGDYKQFRKSHQKGRIGDLEYAKSLRWTGEINGATRDVLVFAKMSQQLVPIEFDSLKISGHSAQATFTIVGS
ncbi:MAG: hypothetical protein D6B28_11640 [Gammaproteobacteria bacterium]|nr:MAG: hypothetical protein D6B28_11640 [Gammaproteobacteria bacterium]